MSFASREKSTREGCLRGPRGSGRFARRILLGVALAVTGAACSGKETPSLPVLLTFKQGHMGTMFTIRIWAGDSEKEQAKSAAGDAFDRVAYLESLFSDYKPDTEIVRLALEQPPGTPVTVTPELLDILTRAAAFSEETGGAFDVTIGPMVRLWRQARKNHDLPTAERIADARARTGWRKIELDPANRTATVTTERMGIDLGGIAKGYAADEALKVLREHGFPRSFVAASGDIAIGDPPPGREMWRIGIRSLDVADAESAGELTGTVDLSDAAISTSGDTEQAANIGGVRYSHIVDPKTALGLTERIAVTVIGPDATTTDSYATAVSVLGREAGLAFVESKAGVECLILEADETGEITETPSSGFPEVDHPE